MPKQSGEKRAFDCCGQKFNLGSPKQPSSERFEQMKIDPKAKKTKSGQYATGEDVLLKLAINNPIVEDILHFRELTN